MLKLFNFMRKFGIIHTAMVIMLSVTLFSSSLSAALDKSLRIIPLPAVELEAVLIQWLIDSGFDVSLSSMQDNQRKLIAARGNEQWIITITPNSPLASHILAAYTLDNRPDLFRHNELWNYLDRYSGDTHKDDMITGQSIPDVVLSQAESVVCIKGNTKDHPIQFSGFILDSEVILSTAHDLEGTRKLSVAFYDVEEITGNAVKTDSLRNLILIDIPSIKSSTISLTKSRNLLEKGERVYSIGRCLGPG
jgi:S1-C subfamily serine protease